MLPLALMWSRSPDKRPYRKGFQDKLPINSIHLLARMSLSLLTTLKALAADLLKIVNDIRITCCRACAALESNSKTEPGAL